MFYAAIINEMNIYEDNKDIYENPLCFESIEEAIAAIKPFIEQGYRVAISSKTFE